MWWISNRVISDSGNIIYVYSYFTLKPTRFFVELDIAKFEAETEQQFLEHYNKHRRI